MKPTKEKINENEFLDDILENEELRKIIGGIDYEDITEKSFEEINIKVTGLSKK